MSICPAPSPLAKHIHRNGRQHHARRDAPDDKEAVAHALDHDPVISIKRQPECEQVLDKVHDGEGLGRLLAVAVDDVCHDASGAELDAEVDQAQAHDHGDGPGVLRVERLTPGEEACCGEEEVGRHDGKSEFRLWGRCQLFVRQYERAHNQETYQRYPCSSWT